ncbi:MAG: lytic polysaccharide monooxygenase [Paraglaciecola sp.]|uniref:lytic polysaccharide monooxygenase n=3 Tax=Paraglaciecola sp. TaxID=1920173 RepID=UPI00329942B2
MNTKASQHKNTIALITAYLALSTLSPSSLAHGLMESPASRNQICGELTKPDQAANGTGLNNETCLQAFADDFNGGYSFMSVLTHAEGRKVVTPLTNNVCGFDSETWQGGATPWDKAIDWPTNTMQSGPNEIVWNISWGPHFDDSEEFVYYITKEDFVFEVGVPLTWDDFEATPFCDLAYDDSAPNANPNVVPDKDNTLFYTYCDVPERTGRHVIYGEWGRNLYTYERFHGCIDAQFSGTVIDNNVLADIVATPAVTTLIGAGNLILDASGSTGDNLSYQWSVSSTSDTEYELINTTSATATLTYPEPSVASTISLTLTVTDGVNTDSEILSLEHLPETITATWILNSTLTDSRTLEVGDTISLRVVDTSGADTYIPATGIEIDSANNAADVWPYELAQAVGTSGDVAIGVLNAGGSVTPVIDATANNIYTRIGAEVSGAFLNIETNIVTPPSSANCEFIIDNEWNNGYVANIRITNNGNTVIEGWEVNWTMIDSTIDNIWNANLTADTPSTASNLEWNSTIQPGQFIEFGFGASKNVVDNAAAVPVISGNVCN